MELNELKLKLYSLSSAAKLLKISRDTLKGLIAQGKIGTIQINKRKKISYEELLRFQNECKTIKPENLQYKALGKSEIKKLFGEKNNNTPPDSRSILKRIMERG